MLERPSVQTTKPRVEVAHPQLFVSDIHAACEFYSRTLGFTVVFVHGDPPFYGQVSRDGVCLNLRHVDEPVFDNETRERESLLSAYIEVCGVGDLYAQFESAGVQFQQTLKLQPWGTQEFVVRDPDGNLLCFGE